MPGQDPTHSPPDPAGNGGAAAQSLELETMLSPRFKSAAAMAGWDEESILFASLIVEDTPDRDLKLSKRRDPLFKAPPPSSDSKRKRRGQRRNPISIHVPFLNLDDEDEPPSKQEASPKKNKNESKVVVKIEEEEEEKKVDKDGVIGESSCSNAPVLLPCLDKLREELSCAICLEICFEPSTTSCGHSFCKTCLSSAADKCGKKCPKCRQLISNGRSCPVNTVIWNTIQLLFPAEVEARKAAEASANSRKERVDDEIRKSSRGVNPSGERISTRVQNQDSSTTDEDSALARRSRVQRREAAASGRRSRRAGGQITSQDGDSDLALRLQRQEFMAVGFSRETDHERSAGRGLSRARANLRAMASRAVSVRSRGQLYL